MAQQNKKFYTVEEAAEILGITPAEVTQRRERNELRGFRDGATWKFKVEDIDAKAREPGGGEGGTDEGDVLLSEVELGSSESSIAGTVINPAVKGPAESDIRLAGSDIHHGQGIAAGTSDIRLTDSDIKLGGGDLLDMAGSDLEKARGKSAAFEELDMTLDEDLTLDEAGQGVVKEAKAAAKAPPRDDDDSAEMEAVAGKKLDDDDVVLGGAASSSGSDVTIGGDSGISLMDPADSGLSLEEPLELSGGDDDSLELGEDDMLTFAEATDTEAPTELKADDEFLLTPLDEGDSEEDSESGSQVIALDTGATASDTAATMVASAAAAGGVAAILDEDFGPAAAGPALGLGAGGAVGGAPLGMQAGLVSDVGPTPGMGPMVPTLPETPYSGLQITSLVCCVLLLVLCSMMTYDLMRNMWSWEGPYAVNSSLMDAIVKQIGW